MLSTKGVDCISYAACEIEPEIVSQVQIHPLYSAL